MGNNCGILLSKEDINRWIDQMDDLYISYRQRFVIAANGSMRVPKGQSGTSTKLSSKYMYNHLIGKFAVAIYAGENASKFMCFDVDDGNPDSVRTIMDCLERCGIERRFIYVSSSGGKGYHVEVFFDRLVSTWMQKRVYAWVIAETGLDRHKIEFRPTSRQAIKLPLCVHHMRGNIRTYWAEVESIIEQGDEAIIKFLMENSADYRAAGALQAQAYLDEWQRRLDALKAAALSTYQQIQSYNYATTQTGTYGGSGGGSSGGSSGGGGSSTKYKFVVAGKTYGPYSSIAAAEAAKQAEIKKIKDFNPGNSSSIIGEGIKAFQLAQITKYKKGGLVNYTGLAMVHGTEKEPEAFLSAEQTKLFAGLAKSLQAVARIQVAKPQGVAAPVLSGDDIRVTFGDVNVSVDKLESSADYDAMAEKVMQAFAAKLRNGKAVGGVFFGRG